MASPIAIGPWRENGVILARIAIVCALLGPALTLARGQEVGEVEGKVSNDDPGRPLQMPPASTEVKEALEDFERFQRRGAWERALKALYTIPEDQAPRFVDGEDGFIISVARKRRDVLAELPPEGRAAYRLFYDAEARKLFDEAEGADEQAKLERVFSAYFTTSVGDDAADRLGDLYFERGRFDRAADCWLAALRDHPDTNLSPAALATKAALALHRAGRTSEFDQLRADLEGRYQNETVTLGGRSAPPAELLESLLGAGSPNSEARPDSAIDGGPLELGSSTEPNWVVPIAETIEAGMATAELNQWRASPLSNAAPAAAVDGSRLYLNYLGHILAIDLESGKLLWRSASFHNLETMANQPAAQMTDPAQFAILSRGEFLWCVTRDMKDPNYNASFQLVCRRADGGEVVWTSTDQPELASFEPSGTPLLGDDLLFVAAESQQNQPLPGQWVLAIRPHDGKLIWKTEVGSFRQNRQRYYYGQRQTTPHPRLLLDAGTLYVDTQIGVLARLDADSGTLEWGFGYQTEPTQGNMYVFYNRGAEPANAGGGPIPLGDALLVKGAQSSRLYAVDPNRMKLEWERAIGKSARPLGALDGAVILGGDEVGSLDIQTRNLSWATRLPGGSGSGAVLVRPDGVRQLTPRGVFEIDPATGDIRSIFRGSDLGAAAGGDLLLTADHVLTVSNRAITAYPRRADAPPTPEEKTPR